MKQLVVCGLIATMTVGCGAAVSPAGEEDTGHSADATADTARIDDTSGIDSAKLDTATPKPDTAGADTAVADTARPDTASPDTAKPDTRPDVPPTDTVIPDTPTGLDTSFDGAGPGDHTTGLGCVDDTTCDVTGAGVNRCSNGTFSIGTLYPTPVCIGVSCDPGDGTSIMGCDDDLGVCLATSTSGICLPACAFGNSGAAPTGCIGKDVCNVLGWGKDATGTLQGVGYCFGGCVVDADCTKGDQCQRESGLCVKTKIVYTKTLGTACTDLDAKAPAKCECLYLTSTNKGYCSTFCKVGDTATACPATYTCSPALPTTDPADGSALFSVDPGGMAGNCLKNCTVDADCTALNSICKTTASGKVCYPN
jgi:hypothetical protein